MIRFSNIEDLSWINQLFIDSGFPTPINEISNAIERQEVLVDPDTESACLWHDFGDYILEQLTASRREGQGRSILFSSYLSTTSGKPIRYWAPRGGSWEQHIKKDKYNRVAHQMLKLTDDYVLWEWKDPLWIKDEYK